MSRTDADEWEDEPDTTVTAKRAKTAVVSFRLPREELDRLEVALAETGESLSEHIRGALSLRLSGAGAAAVRVATGGSVSATILVGSAGLACSTGHDVDLLYPTPRLDVLVGRATIEG